jgi:hypothetical protein
MVQRLAEKYVGELSEMAKHSNLVIVPDKPNDLSGVLTTALGIYGQVNSQITEAPAARPEPQPRSGTSKVVHPLTE